MTTKGTPSSPIATDVACVRCGYNLRGLGADKPCPECGLAAHRTMATGGQLSNAPGAWVTTVAIGAALLCVASLGPFVMAGTNATGLLDRTWYARLLVLFLIFSVHAAGAWLVTVAEPGRHARPPIWRRVAGWAMRVCSVPPAVAVPCFAYMEWNGRWWNETPLLTMSATLLFCPALVMVRLQYLAKRVGRARVAEHALIAGCGLSVSLIAAATLGVVSHRSDFSMWIGAFMIAAGVFWIWSVWVTLMIVWNLRRAAYRARTAWRAADAARQQG